MKTSLKWIQFSEFAAKWSLIENENQTLRDEIKQLKATGSFLLLFLREKWEMMFIDLPLLSSFFFLPFFLRDTNNDPVS